MEEDGLESGYQGAYRTSTSSQAQQARTSKARFVGLRE